MPASDTEIRDLYAQLKGLQVRECELDLHLSQEISTALAHFGPSILALDGTDPLDGDFIALYYQLALRRIGQFNQRISERTSYLNGSKAVQDTLRLMGVRTAHNDPHLADGLSPTELESRNSVRLAAI